MALPDTIATWLKRLSRICGFDTADAFPPGHLYARTRWQAAYFDIASDVKPDEIDRRLADAIANTPSVFAYIVNPTPRMQRALLGVIDERLRRRIGVGDLIGMLAEAYASPHIHEALPGLRTAIQDSAGLASADRVQAILAFLTQMRAPFDVIDAVDAGQPGRSPGQLRLVAPLPPADRDQQN
jgi:hypothetical protein